MTDSNSNQATTKAVLSLVFGILAVTGGCPCIGGVLAIALGSGEKSGVGRAGVILGWIHLGLLVLALIVFAVFLAFAAVVHRGRHF
jgi:cytochrome c biogenesis protein CcdA